MMSARATQQRRSDPLVLAALAWAAGASVVALLFFDVGPLALLLVGVGALPFAATRRSAIPFRILAALLLAAFVPLFGRYSWALLAPPALALLVSAAELARGSRRKRQTRSR
jgi:hypothetical protein